jgi:recombinational DNA repair protein RecT
MDGNKYLDYQEMLSLYEVLHQKDYSSSSFGEEKDPNSKTTKADLQNAFDRYSIMSNELQAEKELIA